jgi:hypothetical protein
VIVEAQQTALGLVSNSNEKGAVAPLEGQKKRHLRDWLLHEDGGELDEMAATAFQSLNPDAFAKLSRDVLLKTHAEADPRPAMTNMVVTAWQRIHTLGCKRAKTESSKQNAQEVYKWSATEDQPRFGSLLVTKDKEKPLQYTVSAYVKTAEGSCAFRWYAI